MGNQGADFFSGEHRLDNKIDAPSHRGIGQARPESMPRLRGASFRGCRRYHRMRWARTRFSAFKRGCNFLQICN